MVYIYNYIGLYNDLFKTMLYVNNLCIHNYICNHITHIYNDLFKTMLYVNNLCIHNYICNHITHIYMYLYSCHVY